MNRRNASLAALVALLLALTATPAFGGKGGNGNGNSNKLSGGSCVVDGTVVHGSGLPTDEVINFMVTDAAGTRGWVLGWSEAGSMSVTVPGRQGPTTYEFVGRTSGPNGSKYTVFASCSA